MCAFLAGECLRESWRKCTVEEGGVGGPDVGVFDFDETSMISGVGGVFVLKIDNYNNKMEKILKPESVND